MRNLFLSLSIAMLFNFANAQWTLDQLGRLSSSNQGVGIGPTTTGFHHFNFTDNIVTDSWWFGLKSDNNKDIFSVKYDYNTTNVWIGLQNRLGEELFKASTFGSDDSMFLHMPQADSRLIIGQYGGYLLSEGHKLVVKDGSAKIEGDFFSTGSIGIGTMSFVDGNDTYKLSVDGKVRAHGVKVYTDWADYVFEDDYELPTLEEVEQHIKEKGHLKDIPSAEEVEENGIEIGEMNKLLLQKIEELTLYTIELKKEIEELKSKID